MKKHLVALAMVFGLVGAVTATAFMTTAGLSHAASVSAEKALAAKPLAFSIFISEKSFAQETAPAPTIPNVQEPQDIAQAVAYLPALIDFARKGNWLLFGSLLTILLTFAIRQWVLPKAGLNVRILPIVSGVLGALVGVGSAILGGAAPEAAAIAVLSGPVGSILWDAVLKYVFNAIAPAPAAVKVS